MLDLSDAEVEELTNQLFSTTKLDFRSYAKSSLRRRFIRLSERNAIQSHKGLLDYLSNISDIDSFVESITVNTTEMFRDPSFWETLRENILPALSAYETIRIWHAGCSTGEEVVSMQILLEELGLRHKTFTLASDINRHVLRGAAAGVFSRKNFDLSAGNYHTAGGRLDFSKYIESQTETTCYVKKDLLANVEFKRLDLVQEQVFKKFDLILCRNVLIYFEFSLQEFVIEKFKNALHKDGLLAIGQKESIINTALLQQLTCINEQEKIYRLNS